MCCLSRFMRLPTLCWALLFWGRWGTWGWSIPRTGAGLAGALRGWRVSSFFMFFMFLIFLFLFFLFLLTFIFPFLWWYLFLLNHHRFQENWLRDLLRNSQLINFYITDTILELYWKFLSMTEVNCEVNKSFGLLNIVFIAKGLLIFSFLDYTSSSTL